MKERLADLFYGLVLLWLALCLAAAYVACAAVAWCFDRDKHLENGGPRK
jgi:hypothetical protein